MGNVASVSLFILILSSFAVAQEKSQNNSQVNSVDLNHPLTGLVGKNDPDLDNNNKMVPKKDLRIQTIPQGYTAIITYNKGEKKMVFAE